MDTYTDYLIGSSLSTTSTGLSLIMNDGISHDSYSRLLGGVTYSSKELWNLVKSTVRTHANVDGILVFDDTISEKPYADENELVCWHYDHSKGRSVKGINLLTGLYVGKDDVSIPVVYELITEKVEDKSNKKEGEISKNERMRRCFDQALSNGVKFKWVITGIWFGSAENMAHIKEKGKDFIMPLKINRPVALSEDDKTAKRYLPIESLKLEPGDCKKVYLYLKDTPYPVPLVKEEYVNKYNSTACLYLVSNDEKATYRQIITIYQKRWKVKQYHKSLKNNVSLAASPTKTVKTQSNYLFICH